MHDIVFKIWFKGPCKRYDNKLRRSTLFTSKNIRPTGDNFMILVRLWISELSNSESWTARVTNWPLTAFDGNSNIWIAKNPMSLTLNKKTMNPAYVWGLLRFHIEKFMEKRGLFYLLMCNQYQYNERVLCEAVDR